MHHLLLGTIWNAHSLYTTRLSEDFSDIKRFLNKYPTEFVIIDLKGPGYYMKRDWYDHYATLRKEIDT